MADYAARSVAECFAAQHSAGGSAARYWAAQRSRSVSTADYSVAHCSVAVPGDFDSEAAQIGRWRSEEWPPSWRGERSSLPTSAVPAAAGSAALERPRAGGRHSVEWPPVLSQILEAAAEE